MFILAHDASPHMTWMVTGQLILGDVVPQDFHLSPGSDVTAASGGNHWWWLYMIRSLAKTTGLNRAFNLSALPNLHCGSKFGWFWPILCTQFHQTNPLTGQHSTTASLPCARQVRNCPTASGLRLHREPPATGRGAGKPSVRGGVNGVGICLSQRWLTSTHKNKHELT
jgi:hypothetical protein